MFGARKLGLGGSARLKPRSEIREDLSGETYTQRVVKKKTASQGRSDAVAVKVEELVKAIMAVEGYTPKTYPKELVGSQSRNLLFEGILISGYQAGQAVKKGTPNKFGIAVGYKLRWLGDEPLHYVYSKALDAKAKKDSLLDMTADNMDLRVANKGDVFYVTRPGIAVILHQPKFNGECSPGVMLGAGDDRLTTNEYMSLIYKNVAVPYIRHAAAKDSKIASSSKQVFAPRQKPVKDYPIYIAVRDGLLDSEERVDVPLKPEFEDQFGVCRSKAKRRKVAKADTRKKMERLASDSMLLNEIYRDNR